MDGLDGLELATLDQIFAELHRRFPSYIFASEREWPGETAKDGQEFMLRQRGSITVGIGLAMRAKVALLHESHLDLLDGEDDAETDADE